MVVIYEMRGGIGNKLFKHHAAYAFSREHNQKLEIYTSDPDGDQYKKLFKHVNFTTHLPHGPMHTETGLSYVPIPDDSVIISGYFQSWKHFHKYEIEIMEKLITNERDTYDRMADKYRFISQGQQTCCVHVRQGDYLHAVNYSDFYTVDETFFKTVVNKSLKLIVFSDEINNVRNWSAWENCDDVHFVDDVPDALETLFLMSMCNNFVISNSSFSLSAYYIRQHRDAQLTVWNKWFGPRCTGTYSIYNIVPPGTNIVGDPVLIFYTCMKNHHKWHRNKGGVIVTGDPDIEEEYIWNPETRRLIVKCEDTYDSLSSKTFKSIKAVKQIFNPIVIIKMNDDTIVSDENLSKIMNMRHDYFGIKEGCDKIPDGPHYMNGTYCGSHMYGLNYRSIDIITNHMKPEFSIFEDYNVGSTLRAFNIYPIEEKLYTTKYEEKDEYYSLTNVDK